MINTDDGSFIFGIEFSPWWFLEKVDKGIIDYTTKAGRIIGCTFTDVRKQERTFKIGDRIDIGMLYTECPVRKDKCLNL